MSEPTNQPAAAASELAPKVMTQIERLGGTFKPAKGNRLPLTLGNYELAPPLRQFLFELEWPAGVTYATSPKTANFRVWRYQPGYLTIERERKEYPFLSKHGDAQIIGQADGGNYFLVIKLKCENPSDPPVYKLDHDEESAYAQGPIPLSQFLAGLKVEKAALALTEKIQQALSALGSEDHKVRYRATKGLAKLKDDSVIPILIDTLSDANAGVRIQAALGLARPGNVRAIKPLALLLNDSDSKVRIAAAESLAKIGDRKALELLIQAMATEDATLKYRIAMALGGVGRPALEPLFEALAGSNRQLHLYAALALVKLGPVTLEGFIKLLNHPDASTRGAVVRALGELGERRAVAPLIAALAEPDSYVRYRVTVALAELGDELAIPALERMAQEDEGSLAGDGFELKVAAAEAIAEIRRKAIS